MFFYLQAHTELGALIVGNPKLPAGVTEQWGWGNLPLAEQEAAMVCELLQTSSAPAMAPSGPIFLTGKAANKPQVLARLGTADCVHFATHVSWQLSAIVLAPPPVNSVSEINCNLSNYTSLYANQSEYRNMIFPTSIN